MKRFILTFALGVSIAGDLVMAAVPTYNDAPDSGCKVAQSPRSFPSRHDFPSAHHETEFKYHLLLHGGIRRRHGQERWSVQSCEYVQNKVDERAFLPPNPGIWPCDRFRKRHQSCIRRSSTLGGEVSISLNSCIHLAVPLSDSMPRSRN
jgi:hypothetical protein